MTEIFGSIWWLIVTIGVLVTFHEFGHFWVARLCGVKVIAFSVGFGRALWYRKDKHGTIFQIAMIPLGGYVKMLDERDQDVLPEERSQAFNQQSVGKRIAIIAAGPIANLILCLLFYWVMFIIGKPDFVPEIGQSTGITAKSGIHVGDILLRVDGVETPTQTQMLPPLMLAAIDRRDVEVVLKNPKGEERTIVLALSQLPENFDQTKVFRVMGLSTTAMRSQIDPIVGEVKADGAAYGYLKSGDRILKVNDIRVVNFYDMPKILAKYAQPNKPITLEIERNGALISLAIQPNAVLQAPGTWQKIKASLGIHTGQTKAIWQFGVKPQSQPPKQTNLRYGPIDAAGKAFTETWNTTKSTLAMLKRLVTGQASVKNVSGTITVAQVANQEASTSWGSFFGFLAFFSLTLCIMNLLPIPVLDGGHLLYYLIELVTGHQVAERIQLAGQFVGMAVLASLMILAQYNDLARIFSF